MGLTSDDVRVDARIALRCATTALPVVSADRQLAMAVAVLRANRLLADLDGRPDASIEEHCARALAAVPETARRARRFASGRQVTPKAFRRHSAPSVVSCAVTGIAQACVKEPDTILRDLLSNAIDDCRLAIRDRVGWRADAATPLRRQFDHASSG
jgi:hypothetical protein